MALAMFFNASGMTASSYFDCIGQLAGAGQGNPDGRTFHVALAAGDDVHVLDIWESQEQFDAFGAVLMPILGALGIDPGTPMVSEVLNVIEP
ncbi:MAG: hypothetical protein ABIR57_01625 [Aeromicrobium sp.]